MTVLVAVADDDLRERVLAEGVRLARAFGEPVSVVHLTRDAVADADARRLRERVEAALADARVEWTVAVEHVGRASARPARSVGHAVADRAADVDVSHVVIGHDAVGWLRGLASGSAAFALVDDADVPVTVVPDGVGASTAKEGAPADAGESEAGESRLGESASDESEPDESKTDESKPSEPKPSKPKPSKPKPSESKTDESKQSEPKPSEPKPDESEPDESPSGASGADDPGRGGGA